jgi:hypothetical protein
MSRRIVPVAGALLVAGAALPGILSHPFQHVYYNALIGGLSGATQRGMEADYLAVSTRRLLPALNGNLQPGDVLFVTGMNPQVFYPPLNLPWRGADSGDLLLVPARVLSLNIAQHLVSAGGRPFLLVNDRRSRPAREWEEFTQGRDPVAEVAWDGVRLCGLYALAWEKGLPEEGVYTRGPVILLEARSPPMIPEWDCLWKCRRRTLEHWGLTWAWTGEDGKIVDRGYETQLVPICSTVFWLPGDVYRAWYPRTSDVKEADLSIVVWPQSEPERETLTTVPVREMDTVPSSPNGGSPVSGEDGSDREEKNRGTAQTENRRE